MKNTKNKKISVIIPTLNGRRGVNDLTHQLGAALNKEKWEYELIYVDDHSTDDTLDYLNSIKEEFPVKTFTKQGKKGKIYSYLEGFQHSEGDIIVQLDADQLYSPEAIPAMIKGLDNFDIVVANRKLQNPSLFRKILNNGYRFIFGQLLLNLNFDFQSGLKVFKKEMLNHIALHTTQRIFNAGFLYLAKKAGYTIGLYDIAFFETTSKKSRLSQLTETFGLVFVALKLRLLPILPINVIPSQYTMLNAGIHYRQQHFITHTTLNRRNSAVTVLVSSQKLFLLGFAAVLVTSLILYWHLTLIVLFSTIVVLYFADLLFNVLIIFRSLITKPEIVVTEDEVANLQDETLPVVTVLCPLYKEESVLSQFIKAMSSFNYPKDKLQVLLLLEEDDTGTIEAAKRFGGGQPPFIQILIVPNSLPKTKPKALNYGLAHASGELVVIYDAEDIPETDQLKKAVIAFNRLGDKVFCLQAKLNFYNPRQNVLTRLFTAEYSSWFDLILNGLYSLNAPIPLGGTSNFFRKKGIEKLEGWDAFNVCEDCDLGLRLYKQGYRTALFNSTTYEEANSNLNNWIRQRSHWIKGYIQSFFIHLRSPGGFKKSLRQPNFLIFLLVVGGKTLSVFINPFLWMMTISYFVFRPFVGHLIESFYPAPIFYLGLFTLAVGNFIYLYNYMLGAANRGHWNLVKLGYLVPFYWLLMSFAAWKAVYQLFFKPYYWEKTNHGLHLKQIKA